MSTKFSLLIDFDLPNTVTLTSRKPEIVLNCRGRHLEKSVTSYFGIGWSDIDKVWQVWQLYAEYRYRTDYGDVVKVKTGIRISIWRMFVFAKRKQLYLGHGLSYSDDIWYADRHSR